MRDHDDLSLLVEAAQASGEIALKYFGKNPDTWEKTAEAGPVTQADLEIDRMLRSEMLASRPDYGWLSEETEDSHDRLDRERVFIVDPIDGTRAFIAGESTFSHSLAIAENGTVVAAAVFLPMKNMMFAAAKNSPATLNGAPVSATSTNDINGATLLAAKPNFMAQHWKHGVPPMIRKFRPSLAYRLCLVANGSYDAMLTLRDCWEWDIAAGDLIVRQAGGSVTDRRNAPLKFNNPRPKTAGCLAAGALLHPSIYGELA